MTAPWRVGILNDMAAGPAVPTGIEPWLQTCVDDLRAQGRIDRPVEFVNSCGLGLPAGTAAAVEHAYEALIEEDVLLVVGPAIGDNALIATPLAERHRTPTVNWAGTENARSEYMFPLQVGSHEDESIVLARHMACLDLTRLGVVFDRSPIGRRHLEFLSAEAQLLGLRIVSARSVEPLTDEAGPAVEEVLGARLEALIYLGLGVAAPAVSRAALEQGWQGPRAMNTAGIRGYASDFARSIEGWIYVDMHCDHNLTLAALRRRLEIPEARSFASAKGHDLGRIVAEGLARAPELTRDGVKQGLERIKWLPAAEGEEGTLLGFGKCDRGALHGRYLMLRKWMGGRSVQVPRNGT